MYAFTMSRYRTTAAPAYPFLQKGALTFTSKLF